MRTTPSNKAPEVSNKAPAPSHQTVRHATPVLAMLLGVAALVPAIPPLTPHIASAASATARRAISPRAIASQKLAATPRFVGFARQMLAQDQDDDDTGDSTAGKASPDEIQKYVAVYRALQHTHSMTVEQAAKTQGLTVGAFRDLERRIESDDLARDDARRALAAPADGTTPAATPKARH